MQIFKVITVGSLLAASLLGPALGVRVEAVKVRQVEVLGEHGLGLVTTSGSYAAAHELKTRDTAAISGAFLGLFRDIKEAAMAIPGHHEDQDDDSSVASGAFGASQTVTLLGTCGTSGTRITSTSPSGSYVYPEATTINACPSLSCYNGVVSQPTEATHVPATIELPHTTVSIPATTDAPEVPGSATTKTTRVISTITSKTFNASSTFTSDTPTNYGPTAPPTVSSPVTGAAPNMAINLFVGGCLMAFVL